jgi:YfiH family protein
MVTKLKGVTLAIATADCGPVLFADAEASVIGAAHAGWKGAFTGILEATLDAMEAIGAKRDRITAVLGPTISQQAYEVGAEFKAIFMAADSEHEVFFSPGNRPEKSQFNLPAFIGYRLLMAGVGAFSDLALCTYADEGRFFSYRRTTHRVEPDYGRLISAITLTP